MNMKPYRYIANWDFIKEGSYVISEKDLESIISQAQQDLIKQIRREMEGLKQEYLIRAQGVDSEGPYLYYHDVLSIPSLKEDK